MAGRLSEQDNQRLRALSGMLIRCFVVGTIAIVFVRGVMFVAGDAIDALQRRLTGLSTDHFSLSVYGFLTLIKCLNVTLFLFPWLAIRWWLISARRATTS